MIRNKIKTIYPHQFLLIQTFNNNVFVADYTEQTKTHSLKRNVEFFSPIPPTDIDYFSIINSPKLHIDAIKFNNSSFVYGNGNPKSQCEATVFPNSSSTNSWILFCELKYSSKPINNRNNLIKAIKQLFKTRYYYIQEGVINKTNTCYLIASLPLQAEPFANFSIPPTMLAKLKVSRNIILRLKNTIEIKDDKVIYV